MIVLALRVDKIFFCRERAKNRRFFFEREGERLTRVCVSPCDDDFYVFLCTMKNMNSGRMFCREKSSERSKLNAKPCALEKRNPQLL